jgi:hypothetical protein
MAAVKPNQRVPFAHRHVNAEEITSCSRAPGA